MAVELQTIETVDLSQRTKWYAVVRLLFVLAITLPGLLAVYLFQGWSQSAQYAAIIATAALTSNLMFFILIRAHRNPTWHAYLAMVWIVLDILLITLFIYLNGGIESRSVILYVVPVLIAAALFGRQGIYMSSLTSTVVYIGLIVFDYFGIIHSTGAYDPTLRTNLPYVVSTIALFPPIFLIIALSVDFIIGLLSEKQKQLRESIDALERAQETAKLGSWEWDPHTNEIAWSRELLAIYGIDPSQRPTRYEEYLQLIHPEDRKAHSRAINDAIKKKRPFKTDHRIMLPDGSERYLHDEGRPVLDRADNVVKLIGTSQDVTEAHYLDSAKREFVSLASHQLRTPASGVKAFLSLLQEGYAGPLNRKQKTFVKKAFESNDRQLEIIESLLSLAAIESGRLSMSKEPLDIVQLVRTCAVSHRPAAKAKHQKLTVNKLPKPVMVTADHNTIQMAIDNLLSNAIKYTPEGGEITVAVKQTSSNVYIEVLDTGIGISKQDMPQLFKKFSRLNDPASKTVGGSGLGLYMAKYIVDLHKGKLSVKSTYGKGTQFTIRLPLAQKQGKIDRR